MQPTTEAPSIPSLQRHRHTYLLASLLLLIAVRPFLGDRLLGVRLLDVTFFVALFVGIAACAPNRMQFWIALTLGTTALAARVAWQPGSDGYLIAFLAISLSFGVLAVYTMSKALLVRVRHVTWDTLALAVSAYLVLGLVFTLAFALLEVSSPGSFTAAGGETDHDLFARFVGFSFTTLTTLGYGNIAPATPRADALANLEAIAGQFYLTVLMARLVAMHLTQVPGDREPA